MTPNQTTTPTENKTEIKVHTWEPPQYWQSVEQQDGTLATEALTRKEFVTSPLQEEELVGASDPDGGVERRDFLKLMAASTALVSMAGCNVRRPQQKIIPYINASETMTPGIPNYYASTYFDGGTPQGILVKTRENRPIKIEGNDLHALSMGGTTARAQASILDLYDQDRAHTPLVVKRQGAAEIIAWSDLDQKVVAALKAKRNVWVLTGQTFSPSTNAVIKDFIGSFSAGKHVVVEALNYDAVATGQELAYGSAVYPRYSFDKADVVVSFGADFLGAWLSPAEHNRQFSKLRKINRESKKMSKLFVFESRMSLTGTNADVRYAVKPLEQLKVALGVALEVAHKTGGSTAGLEGLDLKTKVPQEAIKKCAESLVANRGRGLVVAGDASVNGDLGIALVIVSSFINSMLGNEGATVDGTSSPVTRAANSLKNLTILVDEMRAGAVEALVIQGVNPAFSFPNSGFAEALAKVGTVIYCGDRVDETGALADFLATDQHVLESWNDFESQKGLFSLSQPTIQPLYDTRQFQDSLLTWAKALGSRSAKVTGNKNFHDYIQAVWKESIAPQLGGVAGFNTFWDNSLRDGVVDVFGKKGGRDHGAGARTFKRESLAIAAKVAAQKEQEMSLVVYETVGLADGRYANNAWLNELPDPVTKITWENVASFSKTTADKLGVTNGDVVKVEANGQSLELPAYIQPGQAEDVVAIPVGWGRTRSGRVANGRGSNTFKLVRGGGFNLIAAKVSKTGRFSKLATTQTHHAYDEHFTQFNQEQLHDHPVIREITFDEFQKNPHAGNENEELSTIWGEAHEFKNHRWGMAIDMNSCTGCSACVIACQSENNIPVVGPEQVRKGREMHWIRIDRYYSGDVENPMTVHQPMLCQHCENAPCETVCPVLATVHNDEGLNVQVYNRCVGTRYCSNNCPYKVRRFNWFNFNYYDRDGLTTPQQQWNPEVSVRFRGVMEKCTFCVQRIKNAKDTAKDKGVKVMDGDLKTACQQGCPTEAIQFGDLNNPESAVARIAKDARAYQVLSELNVRPAINYLVKVRNVEEIPGARKHHNNEEGKGHA